jgi:hypothetical protein
MSFRGLFSLGKGEQQAQGGTNNAPTAHALHDIDEQSWQSANLNNATAPNVGGQFGRQGGSIQFDLPCKSNTFGIGGSGTAQGPPAYISQYWEEGQGNNGATTAQRGRAAAGPAQGTITPTAPVIPSKGVYSGMATAVTKWGTGNKNTQTNKLHWQQGVGGDKTKNEQFRKVAGALQEFKHICSSNQVARSVLLFTPP